MKNVIEIERLKKEIDQLEGEISSLSLKQQAIKITLNSLYGALGLPYFRYYDLKNAEAVTLTGQVIIRTIQKELDRYLTGLFPEYKGHFVIGGDTDSVFLTLEALLAGDDFKDTSIEEKVKYIDLFCKHKLSPLIENTIKGIVQRLNGFPNTIKMGREYIGESMIITAKKHYAISYYDKKGIFCNPPKQKITGIEAIRSSTPPFCRELIKETLKHLFTKDNNFILGFIEQCKKRIQKADIDAIAFPRSANNLTKYKEPDSLIGIYKKGCPLQTRAALLFNKWIIDQNLTQKYPVIMEGEKIKFIQLKFPNPINEDVIGWPTNLVPKELNIEQYVDYDRVFQVGYFQPIASLLDAMGWKKEKTQDITDWF